jgi:formylglycine-generating enzyme required for sulfatase activity
MSMVLIPPGEYLMGCAPEVFQEFLATAEQNISHQRTRESVVRDRRSETPQHPVRITRPFYVGKFEVTVADFRRFVAATGFQTYAENYWEQQKSAPEDRRRPTPKYSQFPDGATWMEPGFASHDQQAVGYLTWDDALAFCNWLCTQEGQTYRLPTEAEWEYVCRAGTATPYFFGLNEANYAEYAWRGSRINAVGLKKPNAFGLHDVLGNVHEWCQDRFAAYYYAQSPREDPSGPDSGLSRVMRGGCYLNPPSYFRSALRESGVPATHFATCGLRVVREVQP